MSSKSHQVTSLWKPGAQTPETHNCYPCACFAAFTIPCWRSVEEAWSSAKHGFAELFDGPTLSSGSLTEAIQRLQEAALKQFDDETRALTMKVVDSARPKLVSRMEERGAVLVKHHVLQRALVHLEIRSSCPREAFNYPPVL